MPKKKRNKKRKHTKKEDDNINNNNDNNIIIENNNIDNDNAEIEDEKNDLLKITNIDYEKFIKENNNLFEYLLNSKFPLLIESDKFESEINLESSSFIKIIKQAKLENEFKLYLTKQIITEEINYETYSSKSITYNPKAQDYIKKIQSYNISFPSNNEGSITLDKKVFEKIFSLMNLNYNIDIYNYITFIIIQVSFKYKEKLLSYILNDKNLKKLIEKNKIFYFLIGGIGGVNKTSIPLSNYSTQKIFNLFNGGKDTKYLLIRYKIKNDDEIITNSLFLDKLINASDVKNLLIKYKEQLRNNTLKTLENKKVDKINEIDISDLNNFLFTVSDKLSDIINQINTKKDEIYKLSEKAKNQIISIEIEGINKFINKQYLDSLEKNNDKNNNIDSIIIYDINNENIFLSEKNLENLKDDIEEEVYIYINFEGENYLIEKNDLLKIVDGWKILNQNEIVDVIDIKEFNNIKHKIELLKIKIVEQNDIKDIIYNYKNQNKNKKRYNLLEYVQTLPKKNVYNIRYKHIVEKIHKKQNNE